AQAVAGLYRSLVSEARALELSRREGWRDDALDILHRASALDTPRRDATELRGAAVACLAGFDARQVASVPGQAGPIWSLDFSPDGTRLAAAGYEGELVLGRPRDGGLVRERAVVAAGSPVPLRSSPEARTPAG